MAATWLLTAILAGVLLHCQALPPSFGRGSPGDPKPPLGLPAPSDHDHSHDDDDDLSFYDYDHEGHKHTGHVHAIEDTEVIGPVRNFHVIHATNDSMTVTWDDPEELNLIEGQVAMIFIIWQEESEEKNGSNPQENIVTMNANIRNYTISGLKPDVDYTLKAQLATVRVGLKLLFTAFGLILQQVRAATLPRTMIFLRNLQVKKVTNDSVMVTWDDPEENTLAEGPVEAIRVSWFEFDRHDTLVGRMIVNSTTRSFNVTDLNPSMDYKLEFQVKTGDMEDWGSLGQVLFITTLPIPTPGIVKNLTLLYATDDSIAITWGSLEGEEDGKKTDNSTDDQVGEFKIGVRKNQPGGLPVSAIISADIEEARFRHLEPEVEYEFMVQARYKNVKDWLPASQQWGPAAKAVWTTVQSPLRNLRVLYVRSDSVRVAWDYLEEAATPGSLTGFMVIVGTLENLDHLSPKDTKTIKDLTTRVYTFDGLEANKEYIIVVSTLHADMERNSMQYLVVRTPPQHNKKRTDTETGYHELDKAESSSSGLSAGVMIALVLGGIFMMCFVIQLWKRRKSLWCVKKDALVDNVDTSPVAVDGGAAGL